MAGNRRIEIIQTDLLCIGGGIAGLMAATRAGELGTKVIVADKANTRRSGNGSMGNDHFGCYMPDIHGGDTKSILKSAHMEKEFGEVWLEQSLDLVKLWDSWGIPMKYKGKYEFSGHAFPGGPRTALKYEGLCQKPVLTRQSLKAGAVIMNRILVFELLRDKERVIGALGLDTKNNRIIEFQAKAIFLGTGDCNRLYLDSTPGWIFNVAHDPFLTGDGRAMAYRAGVELADMEFPRPMAGPKYYARTGKATWIGVLRGPDDKPVGPFASRPDIVYGDVLQDIYPDVYSDYMCTGKGPVYMDCRGASQEDLEYMEHWLMNEGTKGILDYMAEEGIDPGKHAIEFRTHGWGVKGGVKYNVKSETSLGGLFAAGDEYTAGITAAAIWGRIAGERAAGYIKGMDFGNPEQEKERTAKILSSIDSIMAPKEGASWREVNVALQPIMTEYCGSVRSEGLLDQGLRNLRRLRNKAQKLLVAGNGHELGRCLEVLNLLDVGEVVMLCARERRETRGRHQRADYPFTNPMLDKLLVVKNGENGPTFSWANK
jgi:succinate dehydrogenase/fumarate reductase flavoprotein subunit